MRNETRFFSFDEKRTIIMSTRHDWRYMGWGWDGMNGWDGMGWDELLGRIEKESFVRSR